MHEPIFCAGDEPYFFGTGVRVTAVTGFPLGMTPSQIKVYEAMESVLCGSASGCYSGIFLKRCHAIPPKMRGMSHAAGIGERIPVYPMEREVVYATQ